MSKHLDAIDAIKLRALRAVMVPDFDAMLRRIFRWYSKEFSTPLSEVECLPLEDVLQHWFEVQYEELEPEDRHNLGIYLLETPEERMVRQAEDKTAEDLFVVKAQKQNEAFLAKKNEKLEKAQAALAALKKKSEAKPILVEEEPKEEAASPIVSEEPEEVVFEYADPQSFEQELETGFGPPPKPKRK